MSNPQHLQYSKDHEWLTAADADGVSTVGITEHAATALGDIVYVQLPAVGDTVTAGETCGELESTKSVSDLYSPPPVRSSRSTRPSPTSPLWSTRPPSRVVGSSS